MTRSPRNDRYHHGDLRAALVAAGRGLLAERGLVGFTLRECARKAGVSHAAPAHHFPAVGDLLAEIAAIGFEELAETMRRFAATAAPGDAPAYLVGLGRGYVAFGIANRAVFQLMFRREAFTFDTERFAVAARAAHGCLIDAVKAVLPDAREEERGLVVDFCWSIVHGFANLVIEGQICKGEANPKAIDRRVTAILETRLRDVLPRAVPPRSAGRRPGQKA